MSNWEFKDLDKILMTVFAIVVIVVGAYAFIEVHGQNIAAVQNQPAPVVVATPAPTVAPTPEPTPAPQQYPVTYTITVRSVSGMPENGFDEVIDTTGRIFDITQAGIDRNTIIEGDTYDVYVTGSAVEYNAGVLIATRLALVSDGYSYNDGYNNYQNKYTNSIVDYTRNHPVIYGRDVVNSQSAYRINHRIYRSDSTTGELTTSDVTISSASSDKTYANGYVPYPGQYLGTAVTPNTRTGDGLLDE